MPTVIDFQKGIRMFPLRRKAAVEAHRQALTKRLKNLALFYLTKVKTSRNNHKASFTEIIKNLIQQKKADKVKEMS